MEKWLRNLVGLSLVASQIFALSSYAQSDIGFGDETSIQLPQLESRLRSLRSDEDRLSRDLRSRQNEAQRLEQQARSDQDVSRVAQIDVERNREAVRGLQQQVRQAESTVSQTRQEISLGQSQIASNSQRLRAAEATLQNATSEASRLEGQRNPSLLQQKKSELQTLSSEKTAIAQQSADYQRSLDQINQSECANTECMVRKITFENAIRDNGAKIQAIDAKISLVQATISQLESVEVQYQRAVGLKNQATAEVASIQQEIRTIEAKVNAAQGRLASEEKNLSSFQTALTFSQQELQTREARARQAAQIAQSSAERADRARQDARHIEGQLQSVSREISDVQRKISEIQNQPRVERTVLVGSRLGGTTQSELSRTGVRLIDIERNSFTLSRERTVYIFADTLTRSISETLSASIVRGLQSGVLVVIVGDLRRVGATGQLQKMIGVESGSYQSTDDVYGDGVLGFLQGVGFTTYAYELSRVSGEVVMRNSYRNAIGISQNIATASISSGRLMVLGLDLDRTGLRILGNVEKALCRNISSQESYDREICR